MTSKMTSKLLLRRRGAPVVEPPPPADPPPPGGNRTVMPDLAAWGDSLTAQIGYTNAIASMMNVAYGQTVDVYRGGRGSQRSEGIAARQGGRAPLVNAVTIPANGVVTVSFTNQIDFMNNYNNNPENLGCTLAGIPGMLSRQSGASNVDCWPFRFTRNAGATTGTVVASGTAMTMDTATLYRQRGHIIRIGHNNRNPRPCTGGTVNMRTSTGPIAQQMYDYATAPAGETARACVVGLITADPALLRFGYTQAEIDQLFADVDYVNADLLTRFGADYCPLLSYLASKQALVDAGIITAAQEPSTVDQQGIDGGYPPKSLQDGIHLNAAGQKVTGEYVGNWIVGLDWRRTS